jgi:hypothetical protein
MAFLSGVHCSYRCHHKSTALIGVTINHAETLKVYVLGGLVDESILLQKTLTTAQNESIATARLCSARFTCAVSFEEMVVDNGPTVGLKPAPAYGIE